MTEDDRHDTRIATATLMRIAEPTDPLMTTLITVLGAPRTCELLARANASHTELRRTVRAVVEELTAAGAGAEEVRNVDVTTPVERWSLRIADADGARDIAFMEKLGARIVLPSDEEWPTQLSDLGAAAPWGLWVRGPAAPSAAFAGAVAIVGARAASNYGVKVAGDLAWDLVGAGHPVISGGAFGIDAAAHRAALQATGGTASTVAFMAGGVDRFYPQGNTALLTEVARTGALVSETSPGMTPMRHRFLLRNRLIAAAAAATVVVEAGWRSGAVNTAHHAAELSRPVGAVPGSIFSAASAGCHRLLRTGVAECVTAPDDVIEMLGPITPDAEVAVPLQITDEMSTTEQLCFTALPRTRGTDVGTVAAKAGLTVVETMSALTGLELAGHARRTSQGWCKTSGR